MNKKTVLISGVTSGIGRAVMLKLLEQDFNVVGFAPKAVDCKNFSNELGRTFPTENFMVLQGDVTKVKSLKNVVSKTLKKFKKIDILINNAGLWVQGALEKNSPERIEEVLKVNTLGTILLTREVLPFMKKHKSGLILNIISQAGLYAKTERSVYNASKWAITGFTKCLQEELKETKIRVTGIYPGMIKTALFGKAGNAKDMSYALLDTQVAGLIAFVVNADPEVEIPEIGLKHNLIK